MHQQHLRQWLGQWVNTRKAMGTGSLPALYNPVYSSIRDRNVSDRGALRQHRISRGADVKVACQCEAESGAFERQNSERVLTNTVHDSA